MLVLYQKLHICSYIIDQIFPVTGPPLETHTPATPLPQTAGAKSTPVHRIYALVYQAWCVRTIDGTLAPTAAAAEILSYYKFTLLCCAWVGVSRPRHHYR